MEQVNISGKLRTEVGKKAAKNLRKNEEILCSLYGGNENINFTTSFAELKTLVYTPQFKLANITINNQSFTAILKDIQFHPVSEKILHIDFLRLVDGHMIKVEIPVSCTGVAAGVKEGGKLIQTLRRVKVKCLPEKLVSEVTLDISSLILGATARVKDINPTSGIEILNSASIPVASITIPRALRTGNS